MLVGHGFRDALWPDAPHRDLLDPVTGAVPVVLVAADLHCCWLNSAAAARYGMADHPTGLVRERDWMPIMMDVRSPAAVLDRWCADAGRAAAARGVVGIVDYEAPWQLDAWAARIAGGADALRVVASVWPRRWTARTGRSPVVCAAATSCRATGGLLTMGPLKVVTDGSLNTRTACCDDPYPGLTGGGPRRAAGGTGRAAAAAGAGAAAARDRRGRARDRRPGQRLVLDTFAALAGRPRGPPAHRARSAPARRRPGAVRRARGGGQRAAGARARRPRRRRPALGGAHRPRLPLPHLLDAGVEIVLGSDAPVAPLDPWITIAAAVHRSGDDRPSWHPEQEIPLPVALAASTGPDGPVRVGRRADLCVTDLDPAAVPAAALRTPVAGTLLGGRWTHRAGI